MNYNHRTRSKRKRRKATNLAWGLAQWTPEEVKRLRETKAEATQINRLSVWTGD